MAIEIKKLTIVGSVNSNTVSNSNDSEQNLKQLKEEIMQECMENIERMLKHKKER